jgi:hypothetical protein
LYVIAVVLIAFCPMSRSFVVLSEWMRSFRFGLTQKLHSIFLKFIPIFKKQFDKYSNYLLAPFMLILPFFHLKSCQFECATAAMPATSTLSSIFLCRMQFPLYQIVICK